MEQGGKDKLSQLIGAFETTHGTLSEKGRLQAIKEIFSLLLDTEGYKANRDSMRRHDYLDYIASTKGEKRTIGIAYRGSLDNISKDEVEELVAGCTIDGIDKVILLTEASLNEAATLYDAATYPVVFEKLDFSRLKNWAATIEADQDDTEVAKILRICTQQIIELIAKNPHTLSELEWRDVERSIAEIFRGLGYQVELTPPAKDGGKDVILEFTHESKPQSYIVEIKHWRSGQNVGQKAIKDFVKVIAKEKRSGGLFLSTYGFTENAVESLTTLERALLRIGKQEKIHLLAETYVKRKAGIWLKDQDLRKILMDETE